MRFDQILWVILIILTQIWSVYPGTLPKVEKPAFLDNFIPASMQVLAHLTELMKFDTRPTADTTTSKPQHDLLATTTTLRPTAPHRPGIYAPPKAPGPEFYFANQKYYSYEEYLERLKQPSGTNYFDRYKTDPSGNVQKNYFPRMDNDQVLNAEGLLPRSLDGTVDGIPVNLYLYFGVNYTDILRTANKEEPVEVPNNSIETQVYEFTKQFDDNQLRIEYNKKQIPPTRAYVTLLSLYDLLNKESKRLGLNKYQGYSEAVLYELINSSQSTSVSQLKFILNKIVDRKDTRDAKITSKIKELITDIDQNDSYINLATKYIPPLVFAP